MSPSILAMTSASSGIANSGTPELSGVLEVAGEADVKGRG